LKGWLVSKDSLPHRERWARVLAPYFDDFEIIIDNEAAADWKPESDFDFVFTTNILDTSTKFQKRIRPDRHIAISNSLDLMVTGAGLSSEDLRSKLPSVREFWVDTNWAVSLLRPIAPGSVRYIPWGLEKFPKQGLLLEGVKNVLVPRLGNSHYNPELSIETIMQVNAASSEINFIFLGLSAFLEATLLKEMGGLKSFRFLPLLPEEGFLSLLQSASAVLMTPKTDGTSIAMLQSLWLGVPVVSTPTIGALEWLASSTDDISAVGSDPATLALAVESSIQERVTSEFLMTAKNRILEFANLETNVRTALRSRLS
jgi:glycosyltransferase involved in cell wall biosynthesis